MESSPTKLSRRQRKHVRAQLQRSKSSQEASAIGIRAAIAAAERVLEECSLSLDDLSSRSLVESTSAVCSEVYALPVHPKPEVRPSSKLSGFGFVLDLSSDGILSRAVSYTHLTLPTKRIV